jgi:Skp family chaperone for outer membrane proteins
MKSMRKLRLGRALIYGFLITVSLFAYDDGVSQCIAEQQTIPAGDRALVAEFQRRVEEYVALHRLLEGQVPTLEVSDDPKEIQAAIEALQKKLRQARATARQGDIFTAEVAQLFRRLIREVFPEGETLRLLSMIAEEMPKALIRPRVNASYPAGASLSVMPTKLLLVFPPLPEELQYRFVDRDLILWDVHANLVVDVVRNAIVPDLT